MICITAIVGVISEYGEATPAILLRIKWVVQSLPVFRSPHIDQTN